MATALPLGFPTVRALALVGIERFEERQVALAAPAEGDVVIRVGAVGLCGTDFHIYEGHANYCLDESGRPIPIAQSPQILGHELAGTVVDCGRAVNDLRPGDRVVVDQGLNCRSRGERMLCEYCASGHSHQCARYAEHGITGLPGGFAEYITVPAVNAVAIDGQVALEQAALVEPLGCVIHSSEAALRAGGRYQFATASPIRSVLICGAGPAGLLFTQYLRNVLGYDGLLMVSEPSTTRRRLAEAFGATAIDPSAVDLVSAVLDLTGGERVHYLIESAGVASLFPQIPGLLRKQGTLLLYGHGHRGVDLGVLNNIQFLEPTLVAACGASGGFDDDGRPHTYRQALALIAARRIDVAGLVTHRYRTFAEVARGFETDRFAPGFIKGVAVWSMQQKNRVLDAVDD